MVALWVPSRRQECEPRQARKGAAVAIVSCAEVWLLELPPFSRAIHHDLPVSHIIQVNRE